MGEERRDPPGTAMSHWQVDDQIQLLVSKEVGHVVQLTFCCNLAQVFIGPLN